MTCVPKSLKTVGRIAPSPSGRMHLGNAFSALLAWASARSQDGLFVLRLEDLDERCRDQGHKDALIEDLKWLGIDWDGAPVVQSNRLSIYDEVLSTIQRKAETYPCFCSRADLHAASAPHASDGTPLYAGTCRDLSDEQRLELAQQREGRAALRIHVPDEDICFLDGVQGPYRQNLARECGDFVLRRSDGVNAYQLVCVVDDIASGVTEVVRGSDLISSTPRQVYLYELLGMNPPEYFHHPLLLAPDGRRLSKRDADLSLGAIRDAGAKPEALVGKIAHLAGQVEEGAELSAQELAQIFDWSKVPKEDIVLGA